MNSHSNASQLNKNILRYLHHLGWKQLNEIQEQSIPVILNGKNDVIISAATASGKTEAAFLPICTSILNKPAEGVLAIYISPLKALINDQFKRIEALGDFVGIRVTPWHGDIGTNIKDKTLENPSGIILITPESLESLLINHSNWYKKYFKNLRYIVIDEFHAFIGIERGYQLLSQMHRIEFMTHKKITRIALSATLSNVDSVSRWLRSGPDSRPVIIENGSSHKRLLLQLRGYSTGKTGNGEPVGSTPEIANDLFKLLRGSTNLVFANSRAETENLANRLAEITASHHLPLEFFPHHGSLSKELRIRLEDRLKTARLPTTAICTQTLELGIDIGDTSSVAQIATPQSVASLRQRIGRSGRRDKDAVLRVFIPEISLDAFTNEGNVQSCLRLETFTTTAILELVLSNWYEPPTSHEYAMSTLIQQILSVISEVGSVKALSLWKLLCKTGPFNLVTPEIFAMILKAIGSHNLISQMRDGDLVLGTDGEKIVSNYNFYTSFKSQEEYTVNYNGTNIGTLPLNQPLELGETFLFAGKGWEVIFFSSEKRQITVKPYKETTMPIAIDGNGMKIHDGVREKIYQLYTSNTVPKYLNRTAVQHFQEGQKFFKYLNLADNRYVVGLDGVYIFPWKGDKIMYTIVQILRAYGIKARKIGSYIFASNITTIQYKDTVNIINNSPAPSEEKLAARISNLEHDKFDKYLTKELQCIQYGYRNFDVSGAMEFFKNDALKAKTPFNPVNNAAYSIAE